MYTLLKEETDVPFLFQILGQILLEELVKINTQDDDVFFSKGGYLLFSYRQIAYNSLLVFMRNS